MTTLERERQYIRKWRGMASRGDSFAMSNVGAAYRILEKFRLSAKWFQRAAESGDGDALMDWGYCLQHGIGTEKDEVAAERAYREAIDSKQITDYSREEAMYHLAVIVLNGQTSTSRRVASKLLRNANADNDYKQAEDLFHMIGSSDLGEICICRRHLRPRLAKRHCPLHGPRKGR